VTYFFHWYRKQGATWADADLTSAVVDLQQVPGAAIGEMWKCAVYAQNQQGFRSATVTSNEVTLTNHAPTPPSTVTIKPPVPVVGGSLSCYPSGAADRDGDPLLYHFRWQNDRGVGTWLDSGDTGDTVPLLTQNSWRWRCLVSVSDGLLTTAEVYSNEVRVTGHAPTAPTAVIHREGGDLVCVASGSTDQDGDSLSYLFTWYRNGFETGIRGVGLNSGGVWTHRATGVLATVGETWWCVVQVFDSRGTASPRAESNHIDDVLNQATKPPKMSPLPRRRPRSTTR